LAIGALIISIPSAFAEESASGAEKTSVQEKAVDIGNLPAAVQDSIRAYAGDHELSELEEIRVDDTIYYEAEWIEGELKVEVRLSSDGSLLEKNTEKTGDDGEDEDEGSEDEEGNEKADQPDDD